MAPELLVSAEQDHGSHSLSIAEKKLISIILAGAAWGHLWHAHQVICQCDNKTVVTCLHSSMSRHPGLMHLIHCLVFLKAHYRFYLRPSYILSKVPSADQRPVPVCQPILDFLLDLPGRLDLTDLAASVQGYFQAGLAHRTYMYAALKCFHEFCTYNKQNRPSATSQTTLSTRAWVHRRGNHIYQQSRACKFHWTSPTQGSSPPCQS